MNTNTRSQVHALVDQLPLMQLAAVQALLESMLDPLSRKLALAPIDDEPFTEEDQLAVAEAVEWSKHNEPIPLEDVLAGFGFALADWETMATMSRPCPQRRIPLRSSDGLQNRD